MLDSVAAMTRFLNLIASEPDISTRPGHARLLTLGGHRSGAQVPPGQAVSSTRSRSRRARRPFLEHARACRRYGAAVVVMAFDEAGQADTRRAQGRDRHPSLSAPDRAGRLRARGRHPGPEHLRHRDRDRGARRLRRRVHRGDPPDQGDAARRARVGRRLATSRSPSAATTRSARRSTRSSCTTPSRPGWTWGSSTPGQLAIYDDIEPELRELVEDVVLDRRPDATERLLAVADRYAGERANAVGPGGDALGLARAAGQRAAHPRAGRGDRRLDRRGHRGGAAGGGPPDRGHRRAR